MENLGISSVKGKELLPIDTAGKIEFVQQAVMIYGRKQLQDDKSVIWDYVVCHIPKGIFQKKAIFF
ncbi:DUF4176 domain-containing protein [Paraliobacillus ryukyuensis]|uniref:DUF4176 domain-containing protein n=1 Tax=Paraliobacillus ryukyuensis TaxID=200904 RepID=UPI000DE9CA22